MHSLSLPLQVNYFNDMVNTTFAGSFNDANDSSRLFLAPGMGHCGGGPGPNSWDKLVPLVDWVENGVATRITDCDA